MKLRIGKDFSLPAEAVTETFAILGIRGAGKTNTGVVLAEELLAAKQQVVILDPVDVWWGLKSGYPIPVIGGEHADVPLEGGAGVVLADFAVDTRASVILSLRHLSMNDQRRFAGDFAKRLYERKGQQRSPLMLMVDEADEFVPQRLPHGHEAMFGAFDRLVRRGRSSGIGVTLISQRAQVVNKDVLSQMETLVGMRVLHKLDRKALEAWIEAHDTAGRQEEFLGSLASLGRGEAWIWSPSWLNVFQRVQIRARHTYDSSATPKAGEKIAAPKDLAPVDLEKLRASMVETIEKAKADDPRELRAEIARLKAELGKKGRKPESTTTPAQVTDAYNRGIREGKIAGAREARKKALSESVLKRMEAAAAKIAEVSRQAVEASQEIGAYLLAVRGDLERYDNPPPPPNPRAVRPPIPAAGRRQIERPIPSTTNGNAPTGGAQQRILDAVAELESLGVSNPPRVQVAFMAGYTNLNSKGFVNAIGALRSSGQVDYPSAGSISLTAAGRAHASAADAPRTGDELRARLVSMLGGASGRIVNELVKAYPGAIEREKLAERAGYTNLNSKGFVNAIGRLRSLGLIDYPQQGYVRAEDILFLEGR